MFDTEDFIATDLGETESDEDLHITISGHQENGGPMYQNITVIYFDTKEKADRSRYSPEGSGGCRARAGEIVAFRVSPVLSAPAPAWNGTLFERDYPVYHKGLKPI